MMNENVKVDYRHDEGAMIREDCPDKGKQVILDAAQLADTEVSVTLPPAPFCLYCGMEYWRAEITSSPTVL